MSTSTINCQNCAAPLAAASCGSRLECGFCGSLQSLPASRLDECVVPLGQQTEHNCPVCRQSLVEAIIGDGEGEFCEVCRGILVQADDFRKIIQQRRADYSGVDSTPTPIAPAALKRIVNCPDCDIRMDVHPYYGPGNTVIDSCRECDLVWLDSGELTAIERAPGRR